MKKKIAIIGAGISGLSCAYFLQKKDPDAELSIFEATDRCGGWVKTNFIGGDPFECGPRSIRISRKSAALLQLVDELGLDKKILLAHSSSRKKYLAYNGQLIESPRNFCSLISTPLGRVALKGLLRDLIAPASCESDETVASFFSRRCGQHVVDCFINPLVTGIYAADPDSISIQAAFSELFELEKKYRSVICGALIDRFRRSAWNHPLKGCVITFQEGMEALPRAIQRALKAAVYFKTSALGIHFSKSGGAVLKTTQGDAYFDYVISAIHPKWLSQCIAVPDVPMTSLVTVALGFKKQVACPQGFGFLASSVQEKELLGCVFDSSVFPEQAQMYQTKLTVMMGGARAPHIMRQSEHVLIEKAYTFLNKYLKISDVPDVSQVIKVTQAIAAYPLYHQEKIVQMNRRLLGKPLALIGAPLYGASLSDCVTHACIELEHKL